MIKMWLLATAIWFGILGFINIIIVGLNWDNLYDRAKTIILILGITIALSSVLGALTASRTMKDIRKWNDGVCPSCGQVWEFKGGSEYRGGHTYYYSCDNCHINIEQHTLR